MVCEVWLDSVISLISQKRTAAFLVGLHFLINHPLQNTIFLVKIDSHWPNSPQMRHGACFELRRSIAAGQQQHFSCFFGLLKNLEVWGFALTPLLPCSRLFRPLFAATEIRESKTQLPGALGSVAIAVRDAIWPHGTFGV